VDQANGLPLLQPLRDRTEGTDSRIAREGEALYAVA
jgi:hypothetical protein